MSLIPTHHEKVAVDSAVLCRYFGDALMFLIGEIASAELGNHDLIEASRQDPRLLQRQYWRLEVDRKSKTVLVTVSAAPHEPPVMSLRSAATSAIEVVIEVVAERKNGYLILKDC